MEGNQIKWSEKLSRAMANNGSKDIHGELLHNVGLTSDEQTSMCNGNGSIEHKIIKDETSSYCSEESADSPLDFPLNGEIVKQRPRAPIPRTPPDLRRGDR